ncbi:MAG TPA: energy transducer TonB [Thermoanaerobaculia bacterium]|nr:energy transducer TonB [Thermoanaerobaculia bacterium]
MHDTLRVCRKLFTAAALLVLLGQAVPVLAQAVPRAEGGPPYRVGGEITRPEIVSSKPPIYTELARRARVMGTVILEAVIDEQGNVTNVRVLKGLPMGLDRAAVEAVQTWKFKPATLKGQPVPVYYVLTVNFQVDDPLLGYGPIFSKFLEQNPEFAAHLRGKRYAEAAELLDRLATERPADPAIPLARIHLLLERGELQEAWQEALKDRGPGRYEGLCGVGALALRQAGDKDLDAEGRAEVITLGLQAETEAMAIRVDGAEAMLYKSMLLRTKARQTLDPAERQALTEEADRLGKQGTDLQKAQGTLDAHPER